MPGTVLANKVQGWRKLIDQIRPLLDSANNPLLAAEHVKLETAVREVQQLDDRADHLRGEWRQLKRLRRETEKKAGEARARVVGMLIGQFGPKNELLIGFGLVPNPHEVRRKTKKGTEPAPAAAATSSVDPET